MGAVGVPWGGREGFKAAVADEASSRLSAAGLGAEPTCWVWPRSRPREPGAGQLPGGLEAPPVWERAHSPQRGRG